MQENEPYETDHEWRRVEVGGYRVLDHGYLKVKGTWGSDEEIIETARMSTDKGFLGWDPGPCPSCQGMKYIPLDKEHYNGEMCHDCAGKGTVPGDAKLLRYLYERHHDTPFEFCGLTIEVQAPIMVFREWHRHRTQCLDGSTPVRLVSPRGTVFTRTIKEIYDLKYGGVVDRMVSWTKNGYSKNGTPVTRRGRYKHPERVRVLPNCQERTLRVLDEESGEYTEAQMADVWMSGEKELFEVRTENGLVVRASADHPFLTKDGWAKLRDLGKSDFLTTHGKVALRELPIPRRLRSAIGTWAAMMRIRLIPVDGAKCYVCLKRFQYEELELDHVVPVSVDLARALDYKNLQPACGVCHRRKTDAEQPDRRGQTGLGVRHVRLSGKPERVAEGMTYDMEVVGKNHNYLAGDLVVHNSYSEMSARYIQMPNLHYVPSVQRIIASAKKSKNKQESGEGVLNFPALFSEGLPERRDAQMAREIQHQIRAEQARIYELYEGMLSWGVSKEIARLDTPVSRYSRMRATANLRNWLAFLTLRMDPAAQFEIRQFAWALADVVERAFPRTWALFFESMGRT